MSGPLTGYKVLDLSMILFGPFAGQILGDMGADVIKIEPPEGDYMRYVGPGRNPGMGPVHLVANRNKRCMVLNLQTDEGKQILRHLVEDADIILHNMRPKPAAKLGLTYEELSAVNPKLIYCACVGFSKNGPYRDNGAVDDLLQSATGLAALIGRYNDGDPKYVPTVMMDKASGLMAVNAITMALLHRERTGEGQRVDVPMFEAMNYFMMVESLYGHTFEPPTGPAGYTRLTTPYRKPYKTKDGFICALPYSDRQWKKFFELGGRPELTEDERFLGIENRTKYISEIYQIVEEIMPLKTTAEWIEDFKKLDIPVQKVNQPEEVLDDEHIVATDFFKVVEHPTEGKIRNVGMPFELDKSPGSVRIQAARKGEHTEDILTELGYSSDEIQKFKNAEAIQK